MPKTTRTQSLYERAVESENKRHANRLKELRAGEKKLALLGLIEEQMKAAGFKVYPSDLRFFGGALRDIGVWGSNNTKLAAWLIANGFRETRRSDYASFSAVTFSKGHLNLELHVPAQQVAP